MNFYPRKLPSEAAEKLQLCPMETIEPYALMLAPIYVFMKLNQKFISIKAPLDFFTEDELVKLKNFDVFYLPEFVNQALPYRDAARSVRALLSWKPDRPKLTKENPKTKYPEVRLPPSSFELGDSILRTIATLWGKGLSIEPYFVTIFVNELCPLIPADLLLEAREKSVDLFEKGAFLSAWGVWLALHMGHSNLIFLNRFRAQYFESIIREVPSPAVNVVTWQLMRAAAQTLPDYRARSVDSSVFSQNTDPVSLKMIGRLKRIGSQFALPEPPSIYGQKGFVGV